MSAEFAEIAQALAGKAFPRLIIPSREEIEACGDHRHLIDLEDEYEAICHRIEICLRFPDDIHDREWFFRARGALMAFTIARGRVVRRLKQLGRKTPRPEIRAA